MVLDPSANFVRQSLGSSVATNDPETIDVQDASAFPDPSSNQYNLVVWDTSAGRPDQDANVEVVRVTGRDTGADTLTVARAQEGTSNVTHPSTSAVQLAYTAKLRDDTDSAVGSMGSFSGTPPTIDKIDVPAVQTESAAITGSKILALTGNGNTIDTFDPANYTDIGAAINAAADSFPDLGNSTRNRAGKLILPQLQSEDFSTTIKAYSNLTIEGQGDKTTELNYTGTGRAIEQQFTTTGIKQFNLRDLRINADDGTFCYLYQPVRCRWSNVSSSGADNAGTRGLYIEIDTANARDNRFDSVQLQAYPEPLNVNQVSGSSKDITNTVWFNCAFDTSSSGATRVQGQFTNCAFIRCQVIDGQSDGTAFKTDGTNVQYIANHIESVDYGYDFSNVAGGEVHVIGGSINSDRGNLDPNDNANIVHVKSGDSVINSTQRHRTLPAINIADDPIDHNLITNFNRQIFQVKTYFNGDTGSMVSKSTAFKGDRSLGKNGGASDSFWTERFTTETGYRYRTAVRGDITAGAGDETEVWYLVQSDGTVPVKTTQSVDNDTFNNTATSSALSSTTWYIHEMRFEHNGDYTAKLLKTDGTELASVTGSVAADSGGLGFKTNNTDIAYWDHITKRPI